MADNLVRAGDQPWIDAWAEIFPMHDWQKKFLEQLDEYKTFTKELEMKSDLIGKVNLAELEPSTLYLHKRSGLVVLTNQADHPIYATVVHAPQDKFAVGTILQHINFTVERLGGKVILQN